MPFQGRYRTKSYWCCLMLLLLVISPHPLLAASLGDPFDGEELRNTNWQWQNEPDEWDVGDTIVGWLSFVPKVNQNLWASDTSIRLYQEVGQSEFDVETHVVMDYAGSCIVAGLVAFGPTEDDWTTLKFWGRGDDAIIQWQHKAWDFGVFPAPQPAGKVGIYLRMAKDGDNYMGWWKMEEGDDWTKIEVEAPIALTPPIQLGIYGGICAGAGEGIISYEYFTDRMNPFNVTPTAKTPLTWGHIKSTY